MRFFDTEYMENIGAVREGESNSIPVEPSWAETCIDLDAVVWPGENTGTGGTVIALIDGSWLQIRTPFRVFRRAWKDYHEPEERREVGPAIDIHDLRTF